MNEHPRIVIIGAGPAGLAAAIQLRRQGYKPRVLERAQPGGLLRNANWVENYPGFPGGIAGPDLVQLFLEQSKRVGVQITRAEVRQLNLSPDGFVLQTDNGSLAADMVVVASGTEPQPFRGVVLPVSIRGQVHYEVSELLDIEDKRILILGAGDAALDYALNLGRRNRVTILNRGSQIKGLDLLWQRVQASPSIDYFDNHEVVAVEAAGGGRLLIVVQAAGQQHNLEADYLIPAIGRRPAMDFLTKGVKNHLERSKQDSRLFFIGDVANDRFRQTAIAVGDGLRVAMEIDYLLMGDRS